MLKWVFKFISVLFSHQKVIISLFFQLLFPLFKEHHEQIEEKAETAKLTVMQKLGLCFKKEKDEKAEKIEKSDLKNM